jgi:hypothetical protein
VVKYESTFPVQMQLLLKKKNPEKPAIGFHHSRPRGANDRVYVITEQEKKSSGRKLRAHPAAPDRPMEINHPNVPQRRDHAVRS